MGKIKSLSKHQKVFCSFLILTIIGATIIYAAFFSKEGYLFHDSILERSQDGETTVYSGNIKHFGKDLINKTVPVMITVSSDNFVTFKFGNDVYGPYKVTLSNDQTDSANSGTDAISIRVSDGEKLFFTGTYADHGEIYSIYDVLGNETHFWKHFARPDNSRMERSRDLIPEIGDIIDLINNQKLTKKGHVAFFILGMVLSLINLPLIFFEEEILMWELRLRFYNVENTERTEFQKIGQIIGEGALILMSLAFFALSFGVNM
ncbi:MAG: hypothetical protein K5655_08680 [Lachnospiraceae bacterium]|nr:hypothetical protein [Lachnospiraceae bacterium]